MAGRDDIVQLGKMRLASVPEGTKMELAFYVEESWADGPAVTACGGFGLRMEGEERSCSTPGPAVVVR